jgi:cob(I)alamin adenosyltransferase
MGITTKKGDSGYSVKYSGERLVKSDAVFETLGVLDELSACIGLVKAVMKAGEEQRKSDVFISQLSQVQRNLIRIGEEVATSRQSPQFRRIRAIGERELQELEVYLESLERRVQVPRGFVLPGDTLLAAWVDLARAVTRRLERRYVAFRGGEPEHAEDPESIVSAYLNRLSDYLFLLARSFERVKR